MGHVITHLLAVQLFSFVQENLNWPKLKHLLKPGLPPHGQKIAETLHFKRCHVRGKGETKNESMHGIKTHVFLHQNEIHKFNKITIINSIQ